MRVLVFILILLFAFPLNAQAEGQKEKKPSPGTIYQCGVPPRAEINTDPGYSYCDIYTRQLAYRDTAISLREQLKERQKNFAEPKLRAYRQYQAAVAKINDEAYEQEAQEREDAEKSEE